MWILELLDRYPFLLDALFWLALALLVIAIAQAVFVDRINRRDVDPEVLARLRDRVGRP